MSTFSRSGSNWENSEAGLTFPRFSDSLGCYTWPKLSLAYSCKFSEVFLMNKTFFLLFGYNLVAFFLFCRMLRVLHQMPGRHSLCIFDCYHPALCWSCTLLWLWAWSTFRNRQHSANLLWDDKICRRCYWCLYPVSSLLFLTVSLWNCWKIPWGI